MYIITNVVNIVAKYFLYSTVYELEVVYKCM